MTACKKPPWGFTVINKYVTLFMQPEFIFTEAEYAKIVGISKEGVRSRRETVNLKGIYSKR